MNHSRALNTKINKLHERALRVVYKEKNLTFKELLEKENLLTIHERNLQKLAIEMYKVKHSLCPKPIQDIFTPSLRDNKDWVLPKVNTVNRGIETIRYMGPKTWELVPLNIKMSETLPAFKSAIKGWKPTGCRCRLCKTYIHDLGYL